MVAGEENGTEKTCEKTHSGNTQNNKEPCEVCVGGGRRLCAQVLPGRGSIVDGYARAQQKHNGCASCVRHCNTQRKGESNYAEALQPTRTLLIVPPLCRGAG
jgi:hypothetical protein